MTTLPQTTPIRLPRVAGPTSLAVPVGGGPLAAGGPAAPGLQMSAGDVWRVIRENLWIIALLCVVSAVGGWFLTDYLSKHSARYSSSAYARIRPIESADTLHGTEQYLTGSLDVEQRTDVTIMHSDGLLDEILTQPDNPIRQTDWFRVGCNGDPQVAHERLAEQLVIEPEFGSELIRVAVTCPFRRDVPVLITAVVNQAITDQQKNTREKIVARRADMIHLREANDGERHRLNSQVSRLSDEITHGGGDLRGLNGPKDVALASANDRKNTLENQLVVADSQFAQARASLDRGNVPVHVKESVDTNTFVQQCREQLFQIDLQLNDLKGTNGPNSLGLQQLQSRRDNVQTALDTKAAELKVEFSQGILDDLANTRATVAKLLDAANQQVTTLRGELATLSTKYGDLRLAQEEATTARDRDNELKKVISDLENQEQQGNFAALEWAERPLEPTSPSFPKLSSIMIACIGSGLALSLGIAFLRELTDTTVRSPRDIVRLGHLALLGMVSHESDDPQSTGARLPMVILEAPHSIIAEQLRQVRTRLQHAASLDTTRSILVTSPGPGDGKSTIACNLAVGLALNGRRILLVDANFRRPELHKIFGIGNDVGFSDVLNDVNAFASAVRETTVPNLSVMPSGSRPGNSTELLESQLLLDAIERSLEEYDHVIFDSGPLLFSSESVALAPRVDGVVTVVRARSSSRGVLTRMRDSLRAVKAEHLGVVLNGVRSQAGGYYGRSIKTYYEYQNAD